MSKDYAVVTEHGIEFDAYERDVAEKFARKQAERHPGVEWHVMHKLSSYEFPPEKPA